MALQCRGLAQPTASLFRSEDRDGEFGQSRPTILIRADVFPRNVVLLLHLVL